MTEGQYRNLMTLVVVVALAFFGLFLVSQDANSRRMAAIEARLGMGTPASAQGQGVTAGVLLDQIQARGGLMGLIFGSNGWAFEARPLTPVMSAATLTPTATLPAVVAPIQVAPTATPEPKFRRDFIVRFVDADGQPVPGLIVKAYWLGETGICNPIEGLPTIWSDCGGMAHVTIWDRIPDGEYAVFGQFGSLVGGCRVGPEWEDANGIRTIPVGKIGSFPRG